MRRAVVALVVILAVAGGAWLVLGRPGLGGSAGASPAPSIPVVPPSTDIVADGRVVPVRWAALTAAGPGKILEVAVAEGDAVTAGQKLVYLDDTATAAQVAAAKAAVDAAKAGVDQATAARSQATAVREAATATVDQAAAAVSRALAVRDQLPAGASSAAKRAANADVTATRAALAVARANARATTSALAAAGAGVTAAEAEVARAVAGVSTADAANANTVITAPFAGTVASLDARVGELAGPGAPEPLVRIADMTSGWQIETTDLDETTVARVAVGAAVTITFDGLPGVTLDGTVSSIALFGATSQGNIVYRVAVRPATLPDGLRWNMTATITVVTGR